MAARPPKHNSTPMILKSAGLLASSMRCLEETMNCLEGSRAALNGADVVARKCWICGKPTLLETCTTDEHGYAVHEECYVAKVVFASESLKSSKRTDAHGL